MHSLLKNQKLPIEGAWLSEVFDFWDDRGRFVKPYSSSDFPVDFSPAEIFFNTSRRGVIRGMHFQTHPHGHAKGVLCMSGNLFDVLLDLRGDSPSYGRIFTIELSANNPQLLYIPEGVAHGFQSLQDNTTLLYLTETAHQKAYDVSISPLSLGVSWPLADRILSARDAAGPTLAQWQQGHDLPVTA